MSNLRFFFIVVKIPGALIIDSDMPVNSNQLTPNFFDNIIGDRGVH